MSGPETAASKSWRDARAQFFNPSHVLWRIPRLSAKSNQRVAYRLHPQVRMKGKKIAAHSLLLLSRDRELRRQLQTCLLGAGLQANVLVTARSERQYLRALGEMRPRLVVFDDDASEGDEMAFLRNLRQKAPETQVVYLTAQHTAERERAVRQLGVLYYAEKPLDSLLLGRLLTSALAALFDAERPTVLRTFSLTAEKRD